VARRHPGDWGAGDSRDDPPVYHIWDASVCCICITHLESWSGFNYSWLQRFDQWIKSSNFWITRLSIPILNVFSTPRLYNPRFYIWTDTYYTS
jgi:hypothetical protein